MDIKKKIISITIFLASIITTTTILTSCMGMGQFGAGQFEEQDEGIEIFTIQRGDILQSIAATGTVDSKTQNNLSLGVSGKILSAPEKGDTFSEGDVLIEIDPSELEDQLVQIDMDIENAKSSLRTAQLNYQKALDANHIAVQLSELNTQQAELSTESAFVSLETANRSADLSLESAQRALEEAREVLEIAEDEGTATDMQIYQYESNIESAEGQVESAKNSSRSSQNQAESSYEQSLISQSTNYWNNLSNLQSAEAQIASTAENIKQAQLNLDAAELELVKAKKSLEDYKILAPYNGIVLSSDLRAEEEASTASAITIISDEFLVKVAIGESDISKISLGEEAEVTLDAFPDLKFTGKVFKIIPVPTEDSGIVSFEVLIEFDQGDSDIYYGLSANAEIVANRKEDILYVPIQAVYTEDGKSYVDLLITRDVDPENISQAVEKRQIETGVSNYIYIEVISGLNEGDTIITSRIE